MLTSVLCLYHVIFCGHLWFYVYGMRSLPASLHFYGLCECMDFRGAVCIHTVCEMPLSCCFPQLFLTTSTHSNMYFSVLHEKYFHHSFISLSLFFCRLESPTKIKVVNENCPCVCLLFSCDDWPIKQTTLHREHAVTNLDL